jgi:hypothetical protein
MKTRMPLPSDNPNSPAPLKEGEDFYWDGPYMVFTSAYHQKRGYCCKSGCRHCPYGFGPEGLRKQIEEEGS